MEEQKKLLGISYMDWAWVIGGGIVAGAVGRVVGFRGYGLSILGAITGYYLRGWKTNGLALPKITDLRQKALAQVQAAHAQLTNGNGAAGQPITGASANQFIVPDPNAAPAPGSEGALAGWR